MILCSMVGLRYVSTFVNTDQGCVEFHLKIVDAQLESIEVLEVSESCDKTKISDAGVDLCA